MQALHGHGHSGPTLIVLHGGPAAFAAIQTPVLMLHGDYDPHPGPMIRDSLLPHIPHLEYREWPRCGHSPWKERHVRDEFFATLRQWLLCHMKYTNSRFAYFEPTK